MKEQEAERHVIEKGQTHGQRTMIYYNPEQRSKASKPKAWTNRIEQEGIVEDHLEEQREDHGAEDRERHELMMRMVLSFIPFQDYNKCLGDAFRVVLEVPDIHQNARVEETDKRSQVKENTEHQVELHVRRRMCGDSVGSSGGGC